MQPTRPTSINKTPLYWLAAGVLFSYLIISVLVYQQIKNTVIENKLDELNQHILFQKSLRKYINTELKPVIYQFQKSGVLSIDYFDPHILSGTYISRNIYQIFDEKLKSKTLHSWKYRVASKNPRNPINQASSKELALLERFNLNRDLDHVHQIEVIDGQETLYFAAPFKPNNPTCIRCHGDYNTAPKDLLKRYGNQNAFNEKMDDIRAFTSYRLNLTDSMANANKTFVIISLIILGFLTVFFILASWVYIAGQKRKQLIFQQQQELEYVAHHDFLTQLSNRHGLNRELPLQIKKLNQAADHFSNFWVLMLDIDWFKSINDDFGHDIGDLTLKKLGEIMICESKKLEHATAYRLGGEEFLITLRNTDAKIIQTLYQSICEALQAAEIEGLNRVIKLSGGATETKIDDNQYSLLKRADNALYQAKEQGRDRLIII